jgi:hypothetical protein
MADDTPTYTIHELAQIGHAYLVRANAHMAHARHSGHGGGSYVPLEETPAEHAGLTLVRSDSPRQALDALDYQLRNLDAGENEALWRAARAILARAVEAYDARGGRRRP